jgi:hypothetical protein
LKLFQIRCQNKKNKDFRKCPTKQEKIIKKFKKVTIGLCAGALICTVLSLSIWFAEIRFSPIQKITNNILYYDRTPVDYYRPIKNMDNYTPRMGDIILYKPQTKDLLQTFLTLPFGEYTHSGIIVSMFGDVLSAKWNGIKIENVYKDPHFMSEYRLILRPEKIDLQTPRHGLPLLEFAIISKSKSIGFDGGFWFGINQGARPRVEEDISNYYSCAVLLGAAVYYSGFDVPALGKGITTCADAIDAPIYPRRE